MNSGQIAGVCPLPFDRLGIKLRVTNARGVTISGLVENEGLNLVTRNLEICNLKSPKRTSIPYTAKNKVI